MEKIYANRLLAGAIAWDRVPNSRKPAVKEELLYRLDEGKITQQQYNDALGIVEETTEPESGEE